MATRPLRRFAPAWLLSQPSWPRPPDGGRRAHLGRVAAAKPLPEKNARGTAHLARRGQC
jgi:hypothetical protein